MSCDYYDVCVKGMVHTLGHCVSPSDCISLGNLLSGIFLFVILPVPVWFWSSSSTELEQRKICEDMQWNEMCNMCIAYIQVIGKFINTT